MSSLIERARLTPEEIRGISPGTTRFIMAGDVADAATTKALSTAAEWLEEKYDGDAVLVRSTDWYRGYMAAVYDLRLAGAKRPQVEAQP